MKSKNFPKKKLARKLKAKKVDLTTEDSKGKLNTARSSKRKKSRKKS